MTQQPSISTSNAISVVHADPHRLLRFGVKLLLSTKGNCNYIAECDSASETLEKVLELKPDLLLIELTLKDKSGIEVIRKLRKDKSKVRILVLSGFEDEATVRQALYAGADGYLLKSATPDSLLKMVASSTESQGVVLPEEFKYLKEDSISGISSVAKDDEDHDPLNKLSKREREVFYLLAEGHPNRVIAKQLFISPRTVETHRARVIRKLGFENTADIIRYAIRNSLMAV